MNGKTVIITGANSGIGLEAAVGIAKLGGHVVMACRNATKADAARADVVARSGNTTVEVLPLDLASFASIRKFAATALERFEHIDVLLNNAGVVMRSRQDTTDGFETTFGVNHLGHFLLTNLLTDRIVATPAARIITVASDAHKFAGKGLDFDDLQATNRYRAFGAYGKSKLANILFTRELARRLNESGVTANCVHPGFVASNFGRADTLGNIAMILGRPFAISAERGAVTSVFLATDTSVATTTGQYFYKSAVREPNANGRDDAVAARLWTVSEELVASKS